MRKFKCILLVDDDPVSNFIHYTILHKLNLGECICMCRNGKEALSFLEEYYQKHKDLPELILVDSFMPIMDGFEFMEAYEKKYGFKKYSTFLFLVSNVYKNEEIDLLNKKNSMPYYLDKPLNKKKLVHILEKNLSLQVTV